MTKRVKGYFVILIKQFDDTMCGAEYHYTPWCIANNKYCRFHKVEKIKKFDFYEDAKKHIAEIAPNNSHDRAYEIAYLTSNTQTGELNSWVKIECEDNAVEYDHLQADSTKINNDKPSNTPSWDSTSFDSLFKSDY